MEDDADTNDGPPIDAELLDYAATLLVGTGVTIDTILSLPLGATPPPTATHPAADPTVDPAQAPEPLPALWAGWSAAARHGAPTGTTPLPPLDPAAAHPAATRRNGDDT
ncbi:hypothetical protein [Kineococcus rhizosphaerae]|uniref:hypothetical protein n=1 Tax=Kineococcus rhizosphaerae TaxID=559628 RepID=UPI0011B23CA9|nr:hypothetical protein [Kineococcus rhizosphaerae]